MSVILCVEDDPAHAFLIKKALKKTFSDCTVVHIDDGQTFVDYMTRKNEFSDPLSSPRPNLVLLDINLPRLNGLDAMKRILVQPDLEKVPIVILTTSESDNDKSLAFENGAADFIQKPSDYNFLVVVLHEKISPFLA